MNTINGKRNMDGFKTLMKRVSIIQNNQLKIGIPQEKATRPGEAATNAELLFILTHGSPMNKVPARPVFEPSLERGKERLGILMKRALDAAMDGNEEKALHELNRTGMQAVSEVRNFIRDYPSNQLAPNSPRVARRKIRQGSNPPKPLINTMEMLKSITYVIISKSGRKVGK